MLKKLLKWIKGEEESLSAIGEAIVSWNELSLSEDEIIRSFIDIHPYISPVSDYTNVIERADACLKNGIVFYPPKSNADTVKKRKFFLSAEGEFIEPSYAITRLTLAAIELLQTYEEKQNLLEKTESDLANIMHLLPVVNNLIHLVKELSEEPL